MSGQVRLRPFTLADVNEHNAGEDAESVRWLTEGQESTVASTTRWIEGHANARRDHCGEQVFAVELDGRLAGMVAANLDAYGLGLAAGEVNLSYAVHPWARRRGVARCAIALMCAWLGDCGLGDRAVIRVDPANEASIRTARSCGFTALGPRTSPSGDVLEHFVRPIPGPQGNGPPR